MNLGILTWHLQLRNDVDGTSLLSDPVKTLQTLSFLLFLSWRSRLAIIAQQQHEALRRLKSASLTWFENGIVTVIIWRKSR